MTYGDMTMLEYDEVLALPEGVAESWAAEALKPYL
jgi:hypothetical protein